MSRESGQATVEWIGIVLALSAAFSIAIAAGLAADGRSFGGMLIHRIACAAAADCDDGDAALRHVYGAEDAALVRRYLPGLVYEPGERQVPVDWRQCRDVACAVARDDRDFDVHRTIAGHGVTVFTHMLRRQDRRYIQYWFYYPDSNTTFAHSDKFWRQSRLLQLGGLLVRGSAAYPGYHRDDWEGASVRVGADGRGVMRVTSHGHWQWCKWASCKGRWGRFDGWTRVSRGSHAGHVPELPVEDLDERTTSPDGIRLVPLEGLERRHYRRLDPDIAPPWLKEAYREPESPQS
jgi:hypothetical protein